MAATTTGGTAPEAEPDLVAAPEPRREYGVVVEAGLDIDEFFPEALTYHQLIQDLRTNGYWMCLDVCVVDYLYHRERHVAAGIVPERFEVVVHLMNFERAQRVRVRVQVSEKDPKIDSIMDIHPGAETPEREAFDMFGIEFVNHPDLTRILMPPEWVGHPLRKDYNIGRVPVQFKGDPLGSGGAR